MPRKTIINQTLRKVEEKTDPKKRRGTQLTDLRYWYTALR
jgi:hypothetical protein